jgi:hypothetical protein
VLSCALADEAEREPSINRGAVVMERMADAIRAVSAPSQRRTRHLRAWRQDGTEGWGKDMREGVFIAAGELDPHKYAMVFLGTSNHQPHLGSSLTSRDSYMSSPFQLQFMSSSRLGRLAGQHPGSDVATEHRLNTELWS